MDPIITYIQMLDTEADPADRVESAENLRDWLARGGFLPLGTERREVMLRIEETLLLAVTA